MDDLAKPLLRRHSLLPWLNSEGQRPLPTSAREPLHAAVPAHITVRPPLLELVQPAGPSEQTKEQADRRAPARNEGESPSTGVAPKVGTWEECT